MNMKEMFLLNLPYLLFVYPFDTEQLVAAGVDRETAEQDACRIDHVISDTSFQKLKEKMRETD